jgi:hypothetical protein
MMATDLTGPFLKELAEYAYHFIWEVDPKTGYIMAWHREYDDPFSPMEVIALKETGRRFRGLNQDADYLAARAVKLETIVEAVRGACEHWNHTALRKGVIKAAGIEDVK